MAKKIPGGAPKRAASATRATSKQGRKGLRCRNLSNEQRDSLLQYLLKHRTSGGSTKSKAKNAKNTTKNKDIANGTNTAASAASATTTTTNANPNAVTTNTELRKGALLEASNAFGVSTKTCKRIWERFLETSDASGSGGDVSHRKHQSGRPKKISAQELADKIKELPRETRSSIRGLARALGMPHTTIHRRFKSGEIKLDCLPPLKGDDDDDNDEEEEADEKSLDAGETTTKPSKSSWSKTTKAAATKTQGVETVTTNNIAKP